MPSELHEYKHTAPSCALRCISTCLTAIEANAQAINECSKDWWSFHVQVAVDGQKLTIIDDSDFTVPANITETDIAACGGSIVHLMDGWLSPCCLGDGDGQCSQARLGSMQRGTPAMADETATASNSAKAHICTLAAATLFVSAVLSAEFLVL